MNEKWVAGSRQYVRLMSMNEINIRNTDAEKIMTIAQVSDCHLFSTDIGDISEEWKARCRNCTAAAESVCNAVKNVSPDLVLFTGDLIEFFSHENLALVTEIFRDIDAPTCYSFGNHDLSDFIPPDKYEFRQDIGECESIWSEQTGMKPGLNSFIMNGINFINLNMHDGSISEENLAQLEQLLEENPAPAIIIGHWPLPIPEIKELIITNRTPAMLPVFINPESRPIIPILDYHPNVLAYISGHVHDSAVFERDHWLHISAAPAYHGNSWNKITVYPPKTAEISPLKPKPGFNLRSIFFR